MTQIWSAIATQRQSQIQQQQSSIRKYFQKFNSPFYYISYVDFCNNFQVHAGKNFKQQNLNIIDTHLKYRQGIYEQMAPYKWTPIIFLTMLRLIKLRRPGLIFPAVYTSLFDYYMEPFFVWLHKDQKIINVKYQFATKLSKVKNKQRRIQLFNKLQKSLKRIDSAKQMNENGQLQIKAQIPYKYIKFGYPSQFIYHSMSNEDTQISTILQSQLFETYLSFRYPSIKSIPQLFSQLSYLKTRFIQYKSSPQQYKYFLNLQQFMKFKDIKQNQIYQLSTCIQKRIRRWIEILMWEKNQNIYFSGWTMDKIFYLYQHKHATEEHKYNIQKNWADLTIYYSLILLPSFILKIFKR